jgi:sulfhydrogenase subunit gamma (sulfur reductase)
MSKLFEPYLMNIEEVITETVDTKTLKLAFADPEVAEKFTFRAGQFGEYSVYGKGEATFCIASSPTRSKGFIECSVKKFGRVTTELHELNVGDQMGFRGPYGNWFPLEDMFGHNLLFVAGGIGLAPVRSIIWNCLDMRDKFKKVTILYGARSVGDLVYKRELEEWGKMNDVELILTVDPGGETEDWKGHIGFVPTTLEKVAPAADDCKVVTCGPPIMIKFTVLSLTKLGFADKDIITTLEMKMKCGLGKCGRCNIGHIYVCKDGPVFTYDQIKQFPQEF